MAEGDPIEIPGWLVERLRAVLDEHADALRNALGRALAERTFPPHPRFRSSKAPSLDEADTLRGIRVIYTYSVFVPQVCGLSEAGEWKCGARALLALEGCLFDSVMEDEFLDSLSASDRLPASQALGTLQTELVENWIRTAWIAARGGAPDLRGYVSEHDGGAITDLDTGERVVNERELGLGYL